jgi:hypothetical protein
MMAGKIFVTQPIPGKALSRLREVAEVELNPDSSHIITKPELIAALKRSDYLLCLLHDTVDAEVIKSAANRKLIASMSIHPAGLDVRPLLHGPVLRADVFRSIPDERHPVILSYGPYAKGLAFQEGYPNQWQLMIAEHPHAATGLSNKYQTGKSSIRKSGCRAVTSACGWTRAAAAAATGPRRFSQAKRRCT